MLPYGILLVLCGHYLVGIIIPFFFVFVFFTNYIFCVHTDSEISLVEQVTTVGKYSL